MKDHPGFVNASTLRRDIRQKLQDMRHRCKKKNGTPTSASSPTTSSDISSDIISTPAAHSSVSRESVSVDILKSISVVGWRIYCYTMAYTVYYPIPFNPVACVSELDWCLSLTHNLQK